MHIRELPEILTKEFGKKYGDGDEKALHWDRHIFRGYELKITNENISFIGALGFRKDSEHTIFILWEGIPRGESSGNVAGPNCRLRIVAGPQKAGSWGAGRGQAMKETAYADVEYPGTINLENTDTKLMIEIISRAHKFATAETTERPRFDEVERYPDRNYAG